MTASTEVAYPHIVFNEQGVPIIQGTTMKVVELIVEKVAYGWSPEELHFQHPYLTLGQIHAALTYYWDHVEALDAEITRRLQRIDDIQAQSLAKHRGAAAEVKLRAQGLC